MAKQLKTYYSYPDIPENFILNWEDSFLSLVTPQEATNLLPNPEVYDTFGYSGTNAITLSNDTVFGLNSIETYTSLGQSLFTSITSTLVAGSYTFSFYLKANEESQFKIYFYDNAGTELFGSTPILVKQGWHRYTHTFTITAIPALFIVPPLAPTCLMVIENRESKVVKINVCGFQLETGLEATTWFSGNSSGYIGEINPYLWVGTPHRSPSYRSKSTYSGGKIVNFNDFGFKITGLKDFNTPDVDYSTQKLYKTFGSLVYNGNVDDREITIEGIFTGSNTKDFIQNIGKLAHYTNPAIEDPIRFIIKFVNCANQYTTGEVDIYARISSIDTDLTNLNGTKVSLSLVMHDIFFYRSGNKSENLCASATLNTSVLRKDGSYSWDSMQFVDVNGVAFNIRPVRFINGPNNVLYLVGNSGVNDQGTIAYYTTDGTKNYWVVKYVSTKFIYDACLGADNKIYFCGDFDTLIDPGNGSDSNGVCIGRYNVFTKLDEYIGKIQNSTLGTFVRGCTLMNDGRIAFVGNFTDVIQPSGATTTVRNIVFYNYKTNTLDRLDIYLPYATIYQPSGSGLQAGLGDAFTTFRCIAQNSASEVLIGGNFVFTYFETYTNVTKFNTLNQSMNKVSGLTKRSSRTSLLTGSPVVYTIAVADDNLTFIAGGYFDSTTDINAAEALLTVSQNASNVPVNIAVLKNSVGRWNSAGIVIKSTTGVSGSYVNQITVNKTTGKIYFVGLFDKVSNVQSRTAGTSTNYADNLFAYSVPNTSGIAELNYKTLTINPVEIQGSDNFQAVGTGGRYTSVGNPAYTNYIEPGTNFKTSDNDSWVFATHIPMTLTVPCTKTIVIDSNVVYPKLYIKGYGKISAISDDNGHVLQFTQDSILLDGEIWTIDFSQAIVSIYSNLYGNIINKVTSGLNIFTLNSGVNKLTVAFDLNYPGSPSVQLVYREQFFSLYEALEFDE